MAEVFDCSDSSQLLAAARAARQALGRGELAVLPTDTVYGVAADAFTPEAVDRLLEAKGRGRQSPPPVLIADTATLGALAAHVTEPVRAMAEEFWPGALTIVLEANPSLSWDLGETAGTVALRIPNHPLTLELLRETGPLAVSSANKTGLPAAKRIADAQAMLGESIAVYLDGGEVDGDGTASTIVDATAVTNEGGVLRVLRDGGVSREALAELLPQVTVVGIEEDRAATEAPASGAEGPATDGEITPVVGTSRPEADGGETPEAGIAPVDSSHPEG